MMVVIVSLFSFFFNLAHPEKPEVKFSDYFVTILQSTRHVQVNNLVFST